MAHEGSPICPSRKRDDGQSRAIAHASGSAKGEGTVADASGSASHQVSLLRRRSTRSVQPRASSSSWVTRTRTVPCSDMLGQEGDDLAGRRAVKVAGRLVGQQHGRLVDQRRAMATRWCSPPD